MTRCYAEASAEFSEKELAYPHLGGGLDQCLEQVRRGLSLDAAGAKPVVGAAAS